MKKIQILSLLLILSLGTYAQWEYVDSVESISGNQHLLCAGSKLFAFNSADIFRSDDEGNSFNKIMHAPDYNIESLEYDNGILYCASNVVMKSLDYGNTWDTIFNPNRRILSLEVDDNEIIISNYDGYYYISEDYGDTWEYKHIIDTVYDDIFCFLKFSSNIYFAVIGNNYEIFIYKSTDNMQSWYKVCESPFSYRLPKKNMRFNIVKTPSNDIVLYTNMYTVPEYYNKFLYSTNNGEAFSELSFEYFQGFYSYNNQSLISIYKSDINAYQLLISKSNYDNWQTYGLSFSAVDFELYNNYLYSISIDCKIYRRDASTLDIADISGNNKFSVFPNPVKNTVNIENKNHIQNIDNIIIYNELGEIVKVISPENYTVDNSKIQIDLSDLRKGVYFISIQADNELVTEKIIKN